MDYGRVIVVTLMVCGAGLIGFGVGSDSTYSKSRSETHKTLIKKDLGMYCPKSGEFAFIGDCK
jgi:hypothetical protein|tara:strand:+ start:281 stop:469 length:189 start_codon:yes stop_codon:yes gene_type:complete